MALSSLYGPGARRTHRMRGPAGKGAGEVSTRRLGRQRAPGGALLCSSVVLVLGTGLGTSAAGGRLAAPPEGLVHPAEWPQVPPAIARDADLEARISRLLAAMRPEQQVGQLLQADIAHITPDDLRQFPLGSVLNGGNSSPGNNVFAPPREWLALADRFYEASVDPAQGP